MGFECHLGQHQECIENALSKAEYICKERAVQFTKLRRRVLELIWQGHKPCKAYDLLKELQKEDSAAKPPTVYRALDFLHEHGLIHRINRLNAYIGCKNPKQVDPSFLLVCLSCDNVEEVNHQTYQKFFEDMISNNQFQCQSKTFEIEGICQNCRS